MTRFVTLVRTYPHPSTATGCDRKFRVLPHASRQTGKLPCHGNLETGRNCPQTRHNHIPSPWEAGLLSITEAHRTPNHRTLPAQGNREDCSTMPTVPVSAEHRISPMSDCIQKSPSRPCIRTASGSGIWAASPPVTWGSFHNRATAREGKSNENPERFPVAAGSPCFRWHRAEMLPPVAAAD